MVAVFNTLNWTRSGLVELFIEYELMPENEDFIFVDQNGKEVPFQIFQRRAEGAYYGLWVENIPPLGYQTIQIKKGESKAALKPASPTLENECYSISVDAKKGVISSIIDKDLLAIAEKASVAFLVGMDNKVKTKGSSVNQLTVDDF